MTSPFLENLCTLITNSDEYSLEELPFVRQAFEDTLAAVFAGWAEPVTRKVASVYGVEELTPDSVKGGSVEAAALLMGTSGHALDFDDVHQASHTHPSIPIVAALVAAAAEEPNLAGRMATAFGVGLATNVALGRVLGFSHYQKGWHATSTIGPVAAAAALSHLYGLDAGQAAHALAIAAAQSGGLQRNFGQMAKPLQAGMAGAAAVRAATLARAGLTADPDVFADKGYFDLYGGDQLATDPEQIEFDIKGGGISVKLYPCCYGNHRHIANALEIRESLRREGIPLEKVHKLHADAACGAYTPLRVTDPAAGLEAKFCLSYNVAAALTDGQITLAHFEDQAVGRAELRSLMEKVSWSERPAGTEPPDGLQVAEVSLTASDADGRELARAVCFANPGSPENPATESQLEAKVADCLAHYARRSGRPYDYDRFQGFVSGLFGQAAAGGNRPVQMALGDD
ncbi:MAG: MmgE/PrpD family protein [bacterium]